MELEEGARVASKKTYKRRRLLLIQERYKYRKDWMQKVRGDGGEGESISLAGRMDGALLRKKKVGGGGGQRQTKANTTPRTNLRI